MLRALQHQQRIDELWDFDDAPASEARFRAALAGATDALAADVLQTQIARALGLQRRFDEARSVLDSLPDIDAETRVRALLERGRVLNTSGAADGARPLFEEALKVARDAGFEFLAIDALHMLAIVAPAEEQADLNEQALALASAASDPRAREWRASLLNNLGWTRFEGGDFAGALALFSDAVEERVRQGKTREIGTARWCVGRTLRALGRVDEALVAQVGLADWMAANGLSDSYVEEEIGECLLELGREEAARSHFAEAARLLAAGGPGESQDPKRLYGLQSQATATASYTSTTAEPGNG